MQSSPPEVARALATRLWQEGLKRQLAGNLEEADRLYRCSLEVYETAEAHTYLGWSLSFRGELQEAIGHCHQAIATDPGFGNAYNDIGAYLVELGKSVEAEEWFLRAKTAERYETPQFPYLNMARIYIDRGEYGGALLELQIAQTLAPEDCRAEQLLAQVQCRLRGEQVGADAAVQ